MADIKVRALDENAPEVKITSETSQVEESKVEEKKRGAYRKSYRGSF